MTAREALILVLRQVDYTEAMCSLSDMVGACLPAEVIDQAKQALKDEKEECRFIAAKDILSGMLTKAHPDTSDETLALWAVKQADALIDVLEI